MKDLIKTEKKFMPGFGWVDHVKVQIRLFGRTFTLWTANHPTTICDISQQDVEDMALTQMFFQKRLQS